MTKKPEDTKLIVALAAITSFMGIMRSLEALEWYKNTLTSTL